MKGILISIEGTDGAGKHTQQQLLLEDLKNQVANQQKSYSHSMYDQHETITKSQET